MIAATPVQIQHTFAQHGLPLHRYATSPSLCDRYACAGVDAWGGRVVYLATAPRAEFTVVVFRTPREAARVPARAPLAVERRGNALLLYLRSARTRLAIVRRIFHA